MNIELILRAKRLLKSFSTWTGKTPYERELIAGINIAMGYLPDEDETGTQKPSVIVEVSQVDDEDGMYAHLAIIVYPRKFEGAGAILVQSAFTLEEMEPNDFFRFEEHAQLLANYWDAELVMKVKITDYFEEDLHGGPFTEKETN